MEPHLSSLQDIVMLTIRQELEWSERRFKRITMSEDANDNPAELYGADGKIWYRKAGGAGVEIGVSVAGGYLPLSAGSGSPLTGDLYSALGSDFSLYGSNYTHDDWVEVLKWDHDQEILETASIILRLDHDNAGVGVNTGINFNRGSSAADDAAIIWNEALDQFNFEAVHGSVYAPLSAAYLKIWSEPLHKAGDIQINNTSGNMEFTDTITGMKTLAELATDSSFTCTDLNACVVTALSDVTSAGSGSIITNTERTKLTGIETGATADQNKADIDALGLDHGALSGRADDDHPQYMLLSTYDPGSDGYVIPTAGGTGFGTYAKGDILYSSATNVLSKLAHGTENQVLTMSATLVPVWAASGLAAYLPLAAGSGSPLTGDLYSALGSDFSLYGSNYTNDDWIEVLKWDHDQEILETASIILRLDHDNTGAGVNTGINFNRGSSAADDAAIIWNEDLDQFNFEAVHGSVYAPLSAAYLKIWSEPAHKGGDIQIDNTSGNMEFTDITGTKTLTELYVGAGGVYLPLAAGSGSPLTGDLYMDGANIMGISDLKGSLNADVDFWGSNAADLALVRFMMWDHANERVLVKKETVFDNLFSGYEGYIALGGHVTNYGAIGYDEGLSSMYLFTAGGTQILRLSTGLSTFSSPVQFSGLISGFTVNLVKFNPLSSVSATEGAMYYDSDDNKLKVYNGVAWETISSSV